MVERREAEQTIRDAPGGVQMSLAPEPGGSLQVDVADGVVTITGKRCRHWQGERATRPTDVAHQILAVVEFSIVNSPCLITWSAAAAKPSA